MVNKTRAMVMLMISALCYALLNVVARLLNLGFEPMTQTYLRIFLGAVVVGMIFSRKIRWSRLSHIPKQDWIYLTIIGVLGYGLMVYFISMGAIRAKLLNVAVVYATITMFTYLYSLIFFRKKFRWSIMIILFISLFGVAVLASKSYIPQLDHFGIGELFVLISAAMGAWYAVARKKLSTYLNNAEISFIVMSIASIATFLLALISGESFSFSSFSIPGVFIGLLLGATLNIISTYAENYAFQHIDAVVGNQMLLSENIFALVLGLTLYKEVVTPPELVGAVIIVGSVYVMNRMEKG
ncbi:MAG: DMT family transporter [Candidatus Pacebacteria bacterium]|nr:DMT family transporter [Candidatus Paceibacterota bacterium]